MKLYKTCPRVIALDGDTKNSTHSLKLKKASNDNYIECFIAEQNLIGVAVGCGTRHRTIPFASTFACFLSRGYDQIRMAAISQANVKFCGSHVGVSIGKRRTVSPMIISCIFFLDVFYLSSFAARTGSQVYNSICILL